MVRPGPLAALLLAGALGRADALSAQARLRPYVEAGVQRPALGNVRDLFRSAVTFYQALGVPVPIQRAFPLAPLVGVGVTRRIGEGLSVGVGGDYSRTRAFALYGDSTGDLDLNATVEVLTLVGIFRLETSDRGKLGVNLETRAGIARASFDLAETVALAPSLGRSTSSVAGRGTALIMEGGVGLTYRLDAWQLGASAGFRFTDVDGPRGQLVTDGQVQESGRMAFSIGGSGPVLRVRMTRTR